MQKQALILEKEVKKRQSAIDEKNPETVQVTAKISAMQKKLDVNSKNKEVLVRDIQKQETEITGLEKDLDAIVKSQKRFEEQMRKAAEEQDDRLSLDDKDLTEYRRLKQEVGKKNVALQAEMEGLERAKRPKDSDMRRLQDKVTDFEERRKLVIEEYAKLINKRDEVLIVLGEKELELKNLRTKLSTHEIEQRRLSCVPCIPLHSFCTLTNR